MNPGSAISRRSASFGDIDYDEEEVFS